MVLWISSFEMSDINQKKREREKEKQQQQQQQQQTMQPSDDNH